MKIEKKTFAFVPCGMMYVRTLAPKEKKLITKKAIDIIW